MALNLTGLTNYVKENELQLATDAVFKPKTAKLIETFGNVEFGIKSTAKINVMTTDAVFQTGGTCGFTSNGTTTFTQRDLNPGKIKVQESICPKQFEQKYTQKLLRAGSSYDYMIFADQFTGSKIAKIGAALETALWQGDILSGNGQLNKFDGLIKSVDSLGFGGAGDPINGNPGGLTTLTTSNVISAVDGVFNTLPANIIDKDNLVIFVGNDTFREYIVALRNQNLFHYPVDVVNMELIIPGTNVKLIGVSGLNGTDKIFGTHFENMFFGTDLLNEEEKFELFFAKEADEMRFVCEFKAAINIAFPDEVSYFKLA
jgi:hypothetical protein